jgi:aspartate ammonia-lyase
VTLLTPKIGYQVSADLFKESLKTGKTIRQLVISKGLLTEKEVKVLLG